MAVELAVLELDARSFRAPETSSIEVRVDDAVAFDQVAPDTGAVPGLLLGNVTTERDEVTIAVTVNGTVAGISPVFEDNAGPRRFGLLIPDSLFVRGRNEVRIYVVEGDGADVESRLVRVDGLG